MKKLILIPLLFSCACAGVSVYRVKAEGDYRGGVRFYRPQPYLMVTQGRDGLVTSIVYLPKTNEEYAVKVHSGLGDVDSTLTFDQGWNLASIGESRKSGTADILSAVGGLGKVALSAVQGILPPNEMLAPGLYALEFDPATGMAVRLRKVELTVEGPGAR